MDVYCKISNALFNNNSRQTSHQKHQTKKSINIIKQQRFIHEKLRKQNLQIPIGGPDFQRNEEQHRYENRRTFTGKHVCFFGAALPKIRCAPHTNLQRTNFSSNYTSHKKMETSQDNIPQDPQDEKRFLAENPQAGKHYQSSKASRSKTHNPTNSCRKSSHKASKTNSLDI